MTHSARVLPKHPHKIPIHIKMFLNAHRGTVMLASRQLIICNTLQHYTDTRIMAPYPSGGHRRPRRNCFQDPPGTRRDRPLSRTRRDLHETSFITSQIFEFVLTEILATTKNGDDHLPHRINTKCRQKISEIQPACETMRILPRTRFFSVSEATGPDPSTSIFVASRLDWPCLPHNL